MARAVARKKTAPARTERARPAAKKPSPTRTTRQPAPPRMTAPDRPTSKSKHAQTNPALAKAPRTAAQRHADLAQASEALRQKLWGDQGQPLTTVEGVTIASALLTAKRPYWHLLTFGLAISGFELSLRVQKAKDELAAPAWAVELLRNLVTRASRKSLLPDSNQVLLLSEGIAPGLDTELKGVLFAPDPLAPTIAPTVGDAVPVLAAVPVSVDEAKAVREWSPSGFVEVLKRVDPLLVADLDRPSLLASPRSRMAIEQRLEREGSSLSTVSATSSTVVRVGQTLRWTLAPDDVDTLISLLKGRIGHQRSFSVHSEEIMVEVVNADAPGAELRDGKLTIKLSMLAARQLRSQLKPVEGRYAAELLPTLEIVVSEGAPKASPS